MEMPARADSWKGSDAERPLSVDGAARMEREAATLALLRLPVGLILQLSPGARAADRGDQRPRSSASWIPFGKTNAWRRIRHRPSSQDILKDYRNEPGLLLVGHEPDFSRVVSACIGGGRVELKKGGMARVDIKNPGSIEGVLVWLLPPRALAAEP